MKLPEIQLIFISATRQGETDIFLLEELDDKEPQNLTKGGWPNRSPSWSPDGKKIVFESKRDGKYRIYFLDLGSGETEVLIRGESWWGAHVPKWSSDGKFIAFLDGGLRLMDISTKKISPLVINMRVGWFDWSPNSKMIAFEEPKVGKDELYLFEVSTGIIERIPVNLNVVDIGGISWSPDGDKLACSFQKKGQNRSDIYLLDIQTGEVQNLTNRPNSYDVNPCWTPDGEFIVFSSDRKGNRGNETDLYVMTEEGKVVYRIELKGPQDDVDVFDPDYVYPVEEKLSLQKTVWGEIKR